MARILSESFEGTGYENSWTETVEGGCELNEDSSIPGTPPGGAGSQCLKALTAGGNGNDSAHAIRTISNQSISYVRAYIYVTVGAGTQTPQLVTLLTSGNLEVAAIQMRWSDPNHQIRFGYSNGSGLVYTSYVNINLSTWYLLEFRYDITNTAWAWKINGTTQNSGSLTGSRTPQKMRIGLEPGGSSTTVYLDLVAWDDTNWIGAEPTPIALTDSLTLADLISTHLGTTKDESITLADAVLKVTTTTKTENITLSDVITIAFIFYRDLTEGISLNDTIATVATFFRTHSETVSLADFISAYAFKQNKPLQSYKTTMLVDFAFTSGTKRFAVEDIMIEE